MSAPFSRCLLIPSSSAHRGQFLHLLLGDVEADPAVISRHGADRDGDLFAPPEVPLPQEHMGGPAVARIDHETLYPPDLTIDGMDRLTGTHVRLPHRHDVLDDHSWLSRTGVISHTDEAAADAFHAGDQLALRGVFEPV